MTTNRLQIVILGLSITSSWGNGHATTYRSLVKALVARGHKVLFLERDVPWYAKHRDLKEMDGCRVELYQTMEELTSYYGRDIHDADVVMVGSYVPDGIAVGRWVVDTAFGLTAFYDLDTPITLADLESARSQYISRDLIPRYDLYLSFTGGPALERLEQVYGSPMARPLFCSVDPETYFPEQSHPCWDMGYLGTYSKDRQPTLESFMLEPALKWDAGRFIVAGPQYPASISWPANVQRMEHLSPKLHRDFYNQQRFTLNITRQEMRLAGFSPSVRLFEAAACGTPIISDSWPGLEVFFEPGKEIWVASCASDVLEPLLNMSDAERCAIGQAAREKVLARHTSAQRAAELENFISEAASH